MFVKKRSLIPDPMRKQTTTTNATKWQLLVSLLLSKTAKLKLSICMYQLVVFIT